MSVLAQEEAECAGVLLVHAERLAELLKQYDWRVCIVSSQKCTDDSNPDIDYAPDRNPRATDLHEKTSAIVAVAVDDGGSAVRKEDLQLYVLNGRREGRLRRKE